MLVGPVEAGHVAMAGATWTGDSAKSGVIAAAIYCFAARTSFLLPTSTVTVFVTIAVSLGVTWRRVGLAKCLILNGNALGVRWVSRLRIWRPTYRSPRNARAMKTAICPLLTGLSGQYWVGEQPLVMPCSRIFCTYRKNGCVAGTSVKKGLLGESNVSVNFARMMKTAISPRVTLESGQYKVGVHPLVIPSSLIFWTYLNNGCLSGTSVKYGVVEKENSSPNLARIMNAAIWPRVVTPSGQNKGGVGEQPVVM